MHSIVPIAHSILSGRRSDGQAIEIKCIDLFELHVGSQVEVAELREKREDEVHI